MNAPESRPPLMRERGADLSFSTLMQRTSPYARPAAASIDADSRHQPIWRRRGGRPRRAGLLHNDKREPRSVNRDASDQAEIVEATHGLEPRDELGRMGDEVEGFDRVALGQTLGFVRDAPGPPEAGGMHPVREVVVGCARVLVDPAARGTHGSLGQEAQREGRDDFLETCFRRNGTSSSLYLW